VGIPRCLRYSRMRSLKAGTPNICDALHHGIRIDKEVACKLAGEGTLRTIFVHGGRSYSEAVTTAWQSMDCGNDLRDDIGGWLEVGERIAHQLDLPRRERGAAGRP